MPDPALPKSRAKAVGVMFAESSVENESVHFSLQRKDLKPLNLRIPARQLGALIANLQRVQETMQGHGVDTGENEILIPSVPAGFFD